jgi:hypothetical protein
VFMVSHRLRRATQMLVMSSWMNSIFTINMDFWYVIDRCDLQLRIWQIAAVANEREYVDIIVWAVDDYE